MAEKVNVDGGHCSNVEEKRANVKMNLDIAWHRQYQRLCAYHARNGNCRVPRFYKADKSLGLWVGNQRMLYRRGTLRPDRKYLLDQIGFESVDERFVWTVERNTQRLDTAWLRMYQVLLEYRDQFGHVDVPKLYVHSNNEALGRWVFRQRSLFAKGNMREDRKLKLEAAGFNWTLPATRVADDIEPLDFRCDATVVPICCSLPLDTDSYHQTAGGLADVDLSVAHHGDITVKSAVASLRTTWNPVQSDGVSVDYENESKDFDSNAVLPDGIAPPEVDPFSDESDGPLPDFCIPKIPSPQPQGARVVSIDNGFSLDCFDDEIIFP